MTRTVEDRLLSRARKGFSAATASRAEEMTERQRQRARRAFRHQRQAERESGFKVDPWALAYDGAD